MGEQLRLLRLARAWTRDDVAERSGIEPRRLFDIEKAKRNPGALTIYRLLEAFDVSADRVLVRKASAKPPPPLPATDVPTELATIGKHVTFWRKALRLTVAKLAERAHLAATTLSAIENAARPVALENYLRVARALTLATVDLFALDPRAFVEGRAALAGRPSPPPKPRGGRANAHGPKTGGKKTMAKETAGHRPKRSPPLTKKVGSQRPRKGAGRG